IPTDSAHVELGRHVQMLEKCQVGFLVDDAGENPRPRLIARLLGSKSITLRRRTLRVQASHLPRAKTISRYDGLWTFRPFIASSPSASSAGPVTSISRRAIRRTTDSAVSSSAR